MHDLDCNASPESTDVLIDLGLSRLHLQLVEPRHLLLIEQRVVPLTPTEYRLMVPLLREAPRVPVLGQEGLLSAPPHARGPHRFRLVLPRCVQRTTLQHAAQLRRSHSVLEHLSRAARKLEVWGITVARAGTGFCLCASLPGQDAEEPE